MRYLAKGVVARQSTEHILRIHHFGNEFVLSGLAAGLWLDARFHVAETDRGNFNEENEIRRLKKMDLVETVEPDVSGIYRALTNCIIVPTEFHVLPCKLTRQERDLLQWITGAGLRLTMAELVYLTERNIRPEPQWLGEENRQKLTEAIYTTETIFDGTLETLMETASSRESTVKLVLSLLRKKRVLLL